MLHLSKNFNFFQILTPTLARCFFVINLEIIYTPFVEIEISKKQNLT